jgi:hypothetical protein
MPYSDDFRKLHHWYIRTQQTIAAAGGGPHVISQFPSALVEIMIKNDLFIVHEPKGYDLSEYKD